MLNNGDGSLQSEIDYYSGGNYSAQVAIADLNRDGKLDIIVSNLLGDEIHTSRTIGVLLGNGDGTFRPVVTFNEAAVAFAVADMNGDGIPDIVDSVEEGSAVGSVNIWLGKGDGTFELTFSVSSGQPFLSGLAVADLNGDGHPDIVVTSWHQKVVAVLLSDGNMTFQAPVDYEAGDYPTTITAVDTNGDGEPDLVISESTANGAAVVLLGKGDGTFQPAATYASGGFWASSATVADVNGDGKPDLLISNCGNSTTSTCSVFATGQLSVLLGNGDGTFQSPTLYSSGGDWLQNVAVADLNGDGKPDIVAANYSFNNTYPGAIGVLFNNSQETLNPTVTSVASSPNPSVFGQTVKLTANVTSSFGVPTGTVLFFSGANPIGVAILSSGTASLTISSLGAGSDSITATYQGSVTFAPSTSAPIIQTVTAVTTSTALASSLNPAGTGQSITYTATVSSQYGGAATGSVTFYSGSQSLGTASLSGNIAALTTSFSTQGTYVITATYARDLNNSGSTSATLNQKIIASTTTALTSSPNPAVVGQTVTFTATVASSSGPPPNGETVTFYNGSAILGTSSLTSGVAALATSSLAVGTYTITATYAGDSNFATSTSPGLKQFVNSTTKSATSTSIASSLNPSTYGQKVTFTATVTNNGGSVPTGKVSFTWSMYTIGTATLNSSGVATLTKSTLNVQNFPLTAIYKGDTNNLGSTSAVLNQVVNQATSTATLTSLPNPSTVGQAVTFTAKITSSTVKPTGPVTFTAGNIVLGTVQLTGGKATLTTSSLLSGSTVVTVTYNGNSNIKGSSASVTQVVQ